MKIRIKRSPRYYSVHTHSKFSYNDALPSVKEVVARAAELGYRGLGLTDHGNMAGTVQLYQECQKAGIKPFPGTEIYLVRTREDKKAKRFHTGVLAYSTEGYKNLVRLNTRAARQFYNKPLLDLADLAEMAEAGETAGLALTTGCYFGLVVQTLVQEGYEAAKQVVAAFAQWFPDAVYVELQHHEIEQGDGWTESRIEDALVDIANELDLQVIVTQDSHYIHETHRAEHESLKRLVAFGPDVDDAVFPGDGFHMADEQWMREHHQYIEKGLDGLDHLLAKHTLTIPQLDHYDYMVPFTVADPQGELSDRCYERLRDLVDQGVIPVSSYNRYQERLEHEFSIVEIARMAGYLLLVAEVTDFCQEKEIFYQARGSAAGSMICWLLGITPVDPLKWGLLMERFLSKDRTKPPDVDLDVEHDRRLELVEWLASRFSVLQIGTWMTYSLSGDDEGKGSLRVRYLSSRRKQGLETDWAAISDSDRVELYALSAMTPYSGYGVHAAGLLLTSTKTEMEDLVPMMYVASSKTFVSQYDMGDVEKLGLVKLDVLGLKTLSVLRQTILNMNRSPKDGLDFIPLNDTATFRTISSGDTAGVFQLEGGTASRGMREMKPTKVKDIIAAMALYRPATMQSGATEAYVRRKHREEDVPQRHDLIQRHTKDTFGILLYQEQVIAVLRDLGLDPDDLTRFLKAVKASNGNIGDAAGVIGEMLSNIKLLCYSRDMTDDDVQWLEHALEAYAGYGFNAAHATVYGLTAYRCAWLATNHPLEFHSALLAVAAGTDKEPLYISATRKRKVRILRADVNYSGVTYGMDPKGRGVRKGLIGIKGVGKVAAQAIIASQPFTSLHDFKERVDPRKCTGVKTMPISAEELKEHEEELVGTVGKLTAAEAFASIIEED